MDARKLKALEKRIVRLIDPLVEKGYVIMNMATARVAYDPKEVIPRTPISSVEDKLCGCLLGMAAFAAGTDCGQCYDSAGAKALDISYRDAGELEAGFENSTCVDSDLQLLGRRIAERYGLL